MMKVERTCSIDMDGGVPRLTEENMGRRSLSMGR
jgi:hypothetical protein